VELSPVSLLSKRLEGLGQWFHIHQAVVRVFQMGSLHGQTLGLKDMDSLLPVTIRRD